jgi:gliding motility-associated-like protein
MFTNPDVILKDLLNPTTIDTIGDNILLWGAEHDIFMKDDNDCPVSNFATSDIREPVATYTWDRPEELVFYGITPQRPKCAGNQGYIIYDVEGGTIPYKYWVQSELSSGSVIPTNQDDDGLVDVPTGLKLYAFVTDKYGCRANIPDSILVTNNNYFETYIKAINDTVKVELTTLKQPYCPLTKDGTVGMQIDGYLFAGVTFTIWRLDTVYNNFYEVFSDVITREEATDSFEVIIDDPTVLPGEFVPEMGYSVAKDTIDYKFRIGDYKITFMDNHTECNVTYFFSLDADTMECTDIYPLIFTPNSDGQNDDWIVSKYEKSDVDLKIFNSEGELVYQFQGQVPEEGLRWNGLDLRNRPVPVGTYMYVYQPDVTRNRDGMEYGTVTLLRNN